MAAGHEVGSLLHHHHDLIAACHLTCTLCCHHVTGWLSKVRRCCVRIIHKTHQQCKQGHCSRYNVTEISKFNQCWEDLLHQLSVCAHSD